MRYNPQGLIKTKFPSPYGDYIFLLERARDTENHQATVSVPLRGLYFFILQRLSVWFFRKTFVSVPLRGLYFFISYLEFNVVTHRFPSPYGDYIFLSLLCLSAL